MEPFAWEEVEAAVQRELGVRISKAFEEFERQPLAAASLGQVHYAELRDGRPVAVKVQRPGIRQRIADDFEALLEIYSELRSINPKVFINSSTAEVIAFTPVRSVGSGTGVKSAE